MSSLKSQPSKFNFTNGASIFMRINIKSEQKREGKKVIFDIKNSENNIGLTIGLDGRNNLLMWYSNSSNETFESNPISPEYFIDKFVSIIFTLNHEENNNSFVIHINKDFKKKTEFEGNLDEDVTVTQVIGANVKGEFAAAFSIKEIGVYGKVLSDYDRNHLLAYLIGKTKAEKV